MKYAKSAALVAGSVIALGTAAPAFAVVATPTAPSFSLDGGVNQVIAAAPQVVDPVVGAVNSVSDTTDRLHEDGTVAKVAGQTTGAVQDAAPLLGGLPAGR
ncbi:MULTISPECIES: hypothetical protein [unclassified Streptomyces]|uniref:hypothetical protein n=1 Tax=unclassified Streptomyces TaxID=2593676 RepID=UPI000DABFCB0|nr:MULTISPECIES: hypothetical protein [unclassified Streptomyces]PZT77422.1 hypothetical protein DNK56_29980 [Streptomyces sp. AC1-42W]PZT78624.1 hypothetical protein DNK55_02700 [Streptomyces sp. AC1-42T]